MADVKTSKFKAIISTKRHHYIALCPKVIYFDLLHHTRGPWSTWRCFFTPAFSNSLSFRQWGDYERSECLFLFPDDHHQYTAVWRENVWWGECSSPGSRPVKLTSPTCGSTDHQAQPWTPSPPLSPEIDTVSRRLPGSSCPRQPRTPPQCLLTTWYLYCF